MLYNTQNPHGGDVYGAAVTLDFSSNVHPLGTPPGVVEAIRAAAAQVRQYPDPYCRTLTAAIAAHEGVPQPYVLCGGGAAELIYAYCDALRPRLAAEPAPTISTINTAATILPPLGMCHAVLLRGGVLGSVLVFRPSHSRFTRAGNAFPRSVPTSSSKSC